MKKIIFATFIAMMFALECQGQVPPTNQVVNLSWTAATATPVWGGCTTTAPCTYIASRIALTAGTQTCPPPATKAPFNYTPLNQSAPVSGTSYTDTTAAGLTVCYIVQTQQSTAISNPSNTVLVVVPGNPVAPAVNQPVTQQSNLGLPANRVHPVNLLAKLGK